ncbi:DCC1-like thiol-disulfide oxidoreductase family protein [Staphylococcus sp. ACRSN]|uniref:thiol-disulfide oxidoreductase DCC family protein n=1 Tax=Staphylococcus sp. ACRSN TaxID=2918214 RepID=UPI001EF22A35|nr:DCC1-like thiol-disulfide oxidoreductase family protein [Staphylococcus sp. ACRSN]MCG7339975.1 DCC1-like thiol-disulfide oxidoreductase family protein [Staphylococcus sp. ACRSN]
MPIIYYDGNCVYCYNYAIWLIQNGLSKKYEFARLQGQTAQTLFDNYPEADVKNSVILQNGNHFEFKSDAIATLITSLTSYKWLGVLLRLTPKFLREFGYNTFANNRNRMWKTHWHKPNAYEQSFFID